MGSEEILIEALKEINLPVKYYEYNGIKEEYIVYNEEVMQLTNYADNTPMNQVSWWQVHIFTPRDGAFRIHREKVKEALIKNGFTLSEITTLYEKDTKTIHVVIPCHMTEREVE